MRHAMVRRGATFQKLAQARGAVRTDFRTKGATVQCRIVLPDGRAFVGTSIMQPAPELGWFGSKVLRKVHNALNRGPIGKLHKKVQDAVAKYLPIAKPFIKIHNALAKPIHKLIEGKKVRLKATAVAIAKVTKDLPIAQKAKVQKALIARAKVTNRAHELASTAALAKAVGKAKHALTGKKGVYKVVRPDGKIVNVPASQVH